MIRHSLTVPTILLCLFSCLSPIHGDVITQWTFETSVPNLKDSSSINGLISEVGVGEASGFHASSATDWDNPLGADGSSESFSANTWAIDDYFQFTTSTVDYENIRLSWAQRGSNTGPRDFKLSYRVNGGSFVDFTSYTVTTISSFTSASSKEFDLSGITALNNAAEVNFRLVATSTTSINNGSVSTSGTSVVDNFTVSGSLLSATAVPEPSTLVFLAGGMMLAWARRYAGKRA